MTESNDMIRDRESLEQLQRLIDRCDPTTSVYWRLLTLLEQAKAKETK